MSSLFGQVWFWSLLAFLIGAVLTWVLLVRPAQQRVQQLERQPRGERPTPESPTGHAQPQQIPPRPEQQAGHPHAPYQQPPSQPAWPGQQSQEQEDAEPHPHTRWLERDSLQDVRTQRSEAPEQRTQQVPEQRLDVPPEAPEQRPEVPGQHTQVPDQREFVPAEPPAPYGQQEEEDFHRELERQYREEYEREYPEDAQGYPEDYRDYAEDEQDYESEYERDEYAEQEFTGRVHPASWQQQPPADLSGSSERGRLGDIDEQPELGGLDDFDAESDVTDRRAAPAQRPGGLFEPSGPAEPDAAYEDEGQNGNGYPSPAAQPSAPDATGTVEAPDPAAEQQDDGAEPDTDPVTGLPRRRRGASNRIRGGFAPPRPIEPSIRPVTRRTPQRGVSSGSLFEPRQGEQAGGVAQASGHADAAEVPPGPFGPGSAMPLPGGGRPDPSFTVKASVTELRYCAEGSPQFASMIPEVWFATPNDAERVGFRPVQ
ncbi:sunset domain-containing protein [Haloechinothrix halophila]|uniref:Uncharacterized protein n=1 Tax=Haloechinothrix halophila YIM 93223 TaxID=592678 RepID=W9DNE1_9PSEU|nr:hypothetical protein [Haloechinothrix halophila]ETA66473.1 hypothetical protein AmyhaDRAFT_0232 [Haloechinothrix halophila YIM 93223]